MLNPPSFSVKPPLLLSIRQIQELAVLTVKTFQAKGLEIRRAALVGSAAILPQPELAKDIDILFLLPEKAAIRGLVQRHLTPEYTWGYDEGTYPLDDFESLRNGPLNLLFVNELEVFNKWILSVNVCRALKLTERESRVLVHQIIMDGQSITTLFGFSQTLELLNA